MIEMMESMIGRDWESKIAMGASGLAETGAKVDLCSAGLPARDLGLRTWLATLRVNLKGHGDAGSLESPSPQPCEVLRVIVIEG
jgi:hypothetical protein